MSYGYHIYIDYASCLSHVDHQTGAKTNLSDEYTNCKTTYYEDASHVFLGHLVERVTQRSHPTDYTSMAYYLFFVP